MVRYGQLRERVRRRGGMRVSMFPDLRDRIVDICVAQWPRDYPNNELQSELERRVSAELKTDSKYGSVILTIIMMAVVSKAVSLIIEWVLERLENRTAMEAWHASARPDV